MKKQVCISLSENELKALQIVANKQGMNVSQYVGLLAKVAVVYHKIDAEEVME